MAQTNNQSLYERVGGKAAVESVVTDFYQRILADGELAPFFTDTDMDKQRRHQAAFVAMALGGPNDYAGQAMRAVHAGRGIQEPNFLAVAGHLSDALGAAGVGDDERGQILAAVGNLKDDVLGH